MSAVHERRMGHRTAGGRLLAVGLLVLAGLAMNRPPAEASQPEPWQPAVADDVAALKAQVVALESALQRLRTEYDERLRSLEAQLVTIERSAALETQTTPAPPAEPGTITDAERAVLEQELAAALGEAATGSATPQEPAGGGQRFTSRTRMLNALNPEISVAGDVFGTVADRTGDPEANQFRFAEFEVAFQAPLDPFSLAKAFVVQEDGEFEVEEAYIDWTSLPGGLGVKLGEFRTDWGKLNRYHQHALPQADRPLVHQAIFGEEGLRGLGASVSWLPPAFLGEYNEVWVQMTNDQNDVAFSGRGFDEPMFLIHETNYWTLSPASYVELGVSAATGVNDELGLHRTQVYGVDWNYSWSPPSQALYRGLEVRGEWLWERRDGDQGQADTHGLYAYGTYKLNQQWYLGLRGDWTELRFEPGAELWGVSPYLEWWQSEWARLRFQYSHNSRQLEAPEPENKFFFQVTWAMGPHKHESY